MDGEVLCQDLYIGGCGRPIHGPAWFHVGEWVDHDGRFPGPHVRPGLPETTLRELAASPEPHVRLAVLDYPGTPGDIVDGLVDDKSRNVRSWARRRTRSPFLLARLAASPDSEARQDAAANPAATADLLSALATDPDWRVRRATLINPSTPQPVIEAATGDAEPRVRVHALAKTAAPGVLERVAASGDEAARRGVAGNPHLPAAVARRLAGDQSWKVRFTLAGNDACPAGVIDTLTRDGNRGVANLARTTRANQHPE